MKSWVIRHVNVESAWRLRLSPSQTADVKSVTSACWMYTTTCTWLIQYILLKVFWVESGSHWCHLPAWSYGGAVDGVRQPSQSMLSANSLSLRSLTSLPCFIILVSGHHGQLRENPISLFKLVGCISLKCMHCTCSLHSVWMVTCLFSICLAPFTQDTEYAKYCNGKVIFHCYHFIPWWQSLWDTSYKLHTDTNVHLQRHKLWTLLFLSPESDKYRVCHFKIETLFYFLLKQKLDMF
jgi:hypothetical protein